MIFLSVILMAKAFAMEPGERALAFASTNAKLLSLKSTYEACSASTLKIEETYKHGGAVTGFLYKVSSSCQVKESEQDLDLGINSRQTLDLYVVVTTWGGVEFRRLSIQ